MQSRTINVNRHKYNTLKLKYSNADHARRNLKRKLDKANETIKKLLLENERLKGRQDG